MADIEHARVDDGLDEKALALVIQTGYYLRGKKRLDGAMRVFSALEKAYPRRAFPHMGLGLVLAEQGQVIEAQARFGRVIARVQGHSMALFAMAFCRMEAGMQGGATCSCNACTARTGSVGKSSRGACCARVIEGGAVVMRKRRGR